MRKLRGVLPLAATPVLALSVFLALWGGERRAASPPPAPPPSSVATLTSPAPTAPAMALGSLPNATALVVASPTSTPTQTATPERTGPARVIDRGPATRQFVALTFDAGADAGYTSQILDVLRAHGVTASFGITGRWAEQNPELLRRIVGEGHHLINHTYDHASFTGLSTSRGPLTRAERWAELDRTADVIRQIAGVEVGPYFRPPYGDYDASVNADVYARGYEYNAMWTVDSLGWRGIAASEIVARCLASATPGAIYIFHVGSQSQDGNALDRVIAGLRGAGYGMGSVPQLIGG